MRVCLFLLVAVLFVAARAGLGQSTPPLLLGAPTPAAEAVPIPEVTLVQAVSDDGRWLLLTSTSERLAPGDYNQAADVFLLDRTTGHLTLVSAGTTGQSGNGTSIAGGLSADGNQAVFLSRASDLTGPDPNNTWDVLARDTTAGTLTRASEPVTGGSSSGPASDPVISADGRFVLFRSPDSGLAPGGVFSVFNLYRRNLAEGRTECVTTSLPAGLNGAWRMTAFASSPDANNLAVTAYPLSGASGAGAVIWRDLAAGESRNCTANLPPELNGTAPPVHVAPALSANGQFVAFRSEVSIAGGAKRYALSVREVNAGITRVLCLRTNAVTAYDPSFPPDALEAQLSTDGSWVAYATPTPRPPSLSPAQFTPLPSQVYLYDALTQGTRLVSAAPDGVTPANTNAVQPRMALDGRGVAFVSRATNLLAGLEDVQLRAFWHDRETGTLTLVANLGDQAADVAGLVLSANGDWLVVSAPGEAGGANLFVFDTRARTTTAVTVASQYAESSTGRGWIGVRPEGVSADGRLVALTAFPPASEGDFTPMQAYLLDTVAGTRRLVTRSAGGEAANGHVTPPALSADGTRLLFVSSATNLVADDANGQTDVFIENLPTGERQMVRGGTWPARAVAQPEALLDPNGAYAAVSFQDLGKTVWQLVSTADGALSPGIPGTVVDAPVFSGDGAHFAVSRSSTAASQMPGVEVYATSEWLDGGAESPLPRWTSSIPARLPTLSARSGRVAFFQTTISPSPSVSNAVVVADYAGGDVLWSHLVRRATLSQPALSADGRFVAWTSPGSVTNAVNQVWRGDTELGIVALVSVATDGTSEANQNSKSAVISPDGRYVAFASLAGNLVSNDSNGAKDIFLRDMQTGQTLLVSRTPSGAPGRGWSLDPFFSADGRNLFFLSHAADLGLRDANQTVDLFKVEILGDAGPVLVMQRNLSTGQAQLLWSGAPGKTYALESTEQLGAGWTRLPGEYAGDAAVAVDTQAAAQTYYRLREL